MKRGTAVQTTDIAVYKSLASFVTALAIFQGNILEERSYLAEWPHWCTHLETSSGLVWQDVSSSCSLNS